MGSDDGTIGRVLTRREALALLGAGGLAALGAGRAAVAAPPGACVARPALTEGPYFVDARLERSDIRSDPADGTLRPGAPARRCRARWWTSGTVTRPASTRTWPIPVAAPSAGSSCAGTRPPAPTG